MQVQLKILKFQDYVCQKIRAVPTNKIKMYDCSVTKTNHFRKATHHDDKPLFGQEQCPLTDDSDRPAAEQTKTAIKRSLL